MPNEHTAMPENEVAETIAPHVDDPTFDFVPFDDRARRPLSRWFWLQWCGLLAVGLLMLAVLSDGFVEMRDYGWTADGRNRVLLFGDNEKIFFVGLLAMLPFSIFLVAGLEDYLTRIAAKLGVWLAPFRRRRLWVAVLILGVGGALFATTHLLLQDRPVTDDEGVYWLQTRILAAGHLTLESLPDQQPLRDRLFEDNIFLVNNGKIFGQYPVGHSFLLLPGFYLGYPHLMPILFAMLTVLGMYLLTARLYGPRSGLAAAALLAVSPMFLATSATLLSHTSTLCFLVWFFYFAHRTWKDDAWWPALGAGLMFFGAFHARSSTALLVGGPVGLGLAVALFADWRRQWRKIAILAALVVATVGLSFYLNYAINGDIMRTNYHAAWGEGKTPFKHPFGFGKGAWHMVHSPEDGVSNATHNLLRLNWWLFGWPLGLLFVLSWLLGREKTSVERLGFASVVFSFAIYFFYFWPGVAETGPVLYYELAAVLIPLTVRGIALAPGLLLTWMPREIAARRTAMFVVVSCLVAFATFHQFNARALHQVTNNVGELDRALTQYGVPDEAVVFTNYYLKGGRDWNHQDSWVVGRPYTSRLLGDKRLFYVNYGKERNEQFLAKYHPGGPAYVVSWTQGGTPEVMTLDEYPVLSLPDNFPDSR